MYVCIYEYLSLSIRIMVGVIALTEFVLLTK
jgi:hypothetical protein